MSDGRAERHPDGRQAHRARLEHPSAAILAVASQTRGSYRWNQGERRAWRPNVRCATPFEFCPLGRHRSASGSAAAVVDVEQEIALAQLIGRYPRQADMIAVEIDQSLTVAARRDRDIADLEIEFVAVRCEVLDARAVTGPIKNEQIG